MKFVVGFLIVCLVAVGLPAVGGAQVITGQPTTTSSSGDSGGGSSANNFTIGLLLVIVAVVVALGWRSANPTDIVHQDGPISLYAMSDPGDGLVYEPDHVVSAGLAFTKDF